MVAYLAPKAVYHGKFSSTIQNDHLQDRHPQARFVDAGKINPDHYINALYHLNRPGQEQIQLDLLYNYSTNIAEYPNWQKWLKTTWHWRNITARSPKISKPF